MGRLFEKFNQEFENQLSKHPRRDEAFEAANESFERKFGYKPYKNNDSFKSARSNRQKRKSKSSD